MRIQNLLLLCVIFKDQYDQSVRRISKYICGSVPKPYDYSSERVVNKVPNDHCYPSQVELYRDLLDLSWIFNETLACTSCVT